MTVATTDQLSTSSLMVTAGSNGMISALVRRAELRATSRTTDLDWLAEERILNGLITWRDQQFTFTEMRRRFIGGVCLPYQRLREVEKALVAAWNRVVDLGVEDRETSSS